jgi:large subunit ribosomal protein L6
MSRIGKLPISVPEGVQIEIRPDRLFVTGPRGKLEQAIPPHVKVTQAGQIVTVTVSNPDDKADRSLWGLFQRLIGNMVIGVVNGFERKLEINGVGYQAKVDGRKVILNVGYSHPVDYPLPEGIDAKVEKNVLTISGIDKQRVGEVAAQIRRVRPPEPYKGKGIKYSDEVIRRKAGKQAKAAGAK